MNTSQTSIFDTMGDLFEQAPIKNRISEPSTKITNPYPKQPGFGLRCHRARMALVELGLDQAVPTNHRAFDDYFEMNDGAAVVFYLMDHAIRLKNKALEKGIRRKGLWLHWKATYQQGLNATN